MLDESLNRQESPLANSFAGATTPGRRRPFAGASVQLLLTRVLADRGLVGALATIAPDSSRSIHCGSVRAYRLCELLRNGFGNDFRWLTLVPGRVHGS